MQYRNQMGRYLHAANTAKRTECHLPGLVHVISLILVTVWEASQYTVEIRENHKQHHYAGMPAFSTTDSDNTPASALYEKGNCSSASYHVLAFGF